MTCPPLPRIILLRHGETQWNRARRYQGQQDSPLTLTGIGQIRAIAHSLRPHLGDFGSYQVWSSPLARTRQSVSILCETLGLAYENVRFDARLMERAYGRWEGLTIDDIATRHPEDLDAEKADRWSFAIPGGGESFAAVAQRIHDWLREIPTEKPILVMAHGGSGRILRGICTHADPQTIFTYNDPQSTALQIAGRQATAIHAEADLLLKYGCQDAGMSVRI